jgi:hypothetical protein
MVILIAMGKKNKITPADELVTKVQGKWSRTSQSNDQEP